MGITQWCWTEFPEPQSQRSGGLEARGWIPSILLLFFKKPGEAVGKLLDKSLR